MKGMLIGFSLAATIAIAFFVLFLTQTTSYEAIASDVASEFEYNYPDFTCTDFSNELVSRLKADGWFAFERSVKAPLSNDWCDEHGVVRNGDCLHSITVLVLPIDSVSGEILTPEKWKAMRYSFFGEATDYQRCLGGFE